MLLDLIGAVALTAASTAVIAVLAAPLRLPAARRLQVAGVLSLWFALVVALGATGAFAADTALGPVGIGITILLPLAALVVAGTHPRLLAPALEAVPTALLIGVNAIRAFGFFFILLYAAGRLPAPFAPTAGWGDVIIGITAVPVALAAAARFAGWRTIALAWNTFGLLDLILAVTLGFTSSPGAPFRIFFEEPGTGIMAGLPWFLIPGFLVPLFAFTHIAVYARLRSTASYARPWAAE